MIGNSLDQSAPSQQNQAMAVRKGAGHGRIAYLINQYPKVSHSFIRREIEAVEAQGIEVVRLALRGWDETLVDSRDEAERGRTTYLLKDGMLPLIRAALSMAFRSPRNFLRACLAAVRMSSKSTVSLPYHLVYLCHACRIIEILAERPVTHLHAHFGTNSAEVALLLRLLGGPPYSFTVHGADEADDGKYLHLESKVRRAEFVAAVSSYTRAQLLRHVHPENWEKVKVVHCGLEPAAFHTDESSTDPVFVSVGRLSPEKGHLILIDAFHAIASRYANASLVLAGDGPLRGILEAQIAKFKLEERVKITGWISNEQVRDEIRKSCVLVQPSFQEGLPVVLMEAMAMSRPVISTYVAGIPELVVPGEVGWLVPPGDTAALSAALEHCLLTPKEELRRMGVAAHRRALSRHSIDPQAAKLVAQFRQSNAPTDVHQI